MNNIPFLEDISVGDEIPPLTKSATTRQLVMYAGASGDFYQIHYDMDYAKNNGLPGVILHGALKNAFLGQVITDWIGNSGKLKMLEVQYKGMDLPGTPVYAKGIVTDVCVPISRLAECLLETKKDIGIWFRKIATD